MSLSTRANFSAGVGYGNQQGGRSGRHHTSPLIPEPTPNLNVRFATNAHAEFKLNKSERSQHPKFLDLIPPSCLRNAPAFPPPIPEVAAIEVF